MSYLEYRKNKKIAKREMARLAATALPLLNEVSDKHSEIIQFALDTTKACKNLGGEKLVEKVLNEISILLKTTQPRLLEIMTYLAGMSPEDIQKVLVHATVHSNKELKTE